MSQGFCHRETETEFLMQDRHGTGQASAKAVMLGHACSMHDRHRGSCTTCVRNSLNPPDSDIVAVHNVAEMLAEEGYTGDRAPNLFFSEEPNAVLSKEDRVSSATTCPPHSQDGESARYINKLCLLRMTASQSDLALIMLIRASQIISKQH